MKQLLSSSDGHLPRAVLPLVLSILFGLLSLLLSGYSITFIFGEISVDIVWVMIFPVIISLAYGKSYALVSALAGGGWFPFLIWQNNGWANVLNFILLTLFYFSVASITPVHASLHGWRVYRRLLVLFSWFFPLMAVAYLVVFPLLLSMNPVFWARESVTSIPLQVRLYFVIKDALIFLFITAVAETLLRLPLVRLLLGKRTPEAMQRNNTLFTVSVSGALVVWLSFLLLDVLFISDLALLNRPYLSIALMLMLGFSTFAARGLISFSEKMHITNAVLKGSQQRLHASLQEREVLIRELYHRTKNNLQTINSLISLRVGESENTEVRDLYFEIENQIATMSLIHTKLYQSGNLSHMHILSFMEEMYDLVSVSFNKSACVSFTAEGYDLILPLQKAIPLGIIITELLMNSFKYAFSDMETGVISVSIEKQDHHDVCITYSDNGVGVPNVESLHDNDGIGVATVFAVAEGQLGAKVEVDYNSGLTYRILCAL
ncbi:sensor histidine kinase [Spirochaeta dissipatitropha]